MMMMVMLMMMMTTTMTMIIITTIRRRRNKILIVVIMTMTMTMTLTMTKWDTTWFLLGARRMASLHPNRAGRAADERGAPTGGRRPEAAMGIWREYQLNMMKKNVIKKYENIYIYLCRYIYIYVYVCTQWEYNIVGLGIHWDIIWKKKPGE